MQGTTKHSVMMMRANYFSSRTAKVYSCPSLFANETFFDGCTKRKSPCLEKRFLFTIACIVKTNNKQRPRSFKIQFLIALKYQAVCPYRGCVKHLCKSIN